MAHEFTGRLHAFGPGKRFDLTRHLVGQLDRQWVVQLAAHRKAPALHRAANVSEATDSRSRMEPTAVAQDEGECFMWSGGLALFVLSGGKPVNQGLDRVYAWVLPVAVDDLSRQRLRHACLGSDTLPLRRRDAAQIPAQQVKDGFMCHGGQHCNPENGKPVNVPTGYGIAQPLRCLP